MHSWDIDAVFLLNFGVSIAQLGFVSLCLRRHGRHSLATEVGVKLKNGNGFKPRKRRPEPSLKPRTYD
ncbi:hypothetical protein Bra471DRAFT_01690 [Bradyrhizobium sp. WSM471]|nr:hypothetical protein Bra471DRAFT_01690 [Bradyrhizobium sp. WSM471]